MNVTVIGSGGREHALTLKISESKQVDKLFTVPGNPGTMNISTNLNIDVKDHAAMLKHCRDEKIDLVVIGPEQPLVDGLADFLRAEGINVFGPDKDAAMIEGDKSFSKELMQKYDIPTAEFRKFTESEYDECIKYLEGIEYPTVIKASGLAAGKGVLICENKESAIEAVDDMFRKKVFGSSGETIVIEEHMYGQETSIFAITDGKNFVTLPASQDHKRIFDGDKGKNTGGMGAYAPAPIVTDELTENIEDNIIRKTIDALNAEGRKYIGCLYAGLMLTEEGPKVVEFNCRFGDPETQAVLPIIDGDFFELLYSAARGKISSESVSSSVSCAVCVVTSSAGYPQSYEKGFEINGLENTDKMDDVIVYHAGTKLSDEKIVTNGGRVLGVTAIDRRGELSDCKSLAYKAIDKIDYNGKYFRTDISDKALNQ
jgi:phosphoribosylamine--glycine ligase